MIIDKAIAKVWKKIVMKYRGLPVLIVVYKPWVKGKNVFFEEITPFSSDPYLNELFDKIATHIRENWQEQLEAALKDANQ